MAGVLVVPVLAIAVPMATVGAAAAGRTVP
jgi:hypothetical protein